MTESQKKFAYAYVMDGMSRSEAYRKAYPAAEKLSAKQVSGRADKVMKSPAVLAEIERLRRLCRDAEVITRDELLRDVKELLDAARDGSFEDEVSGGEVRRVLIPKSADIYLKAIDRAAKLIGAEEPERSQGEIIVHFGDGLERYRQ